MTAAVAAPLTCRGPAGSRAPTASARCRAAPRWTATCRAHTPPPRCRPAARPGAFKGEERGRGGGVGGAVRLRWGPPRGGARGAPLQLPPRPPAAHRLDGACRAGHCGRRAARRRGRREDGAARGRRRRAAGAGVCRVCHGAAAFGRRAALGVAGGANETARRGARRASRWPPLLLRARAAARGGAPAVGRMHGRAAAWCSSGALPLRVGGGPADHAPRSRAGGRARNWARSNGNGERAPADRDPGGGTAAPRRSCPTAAAPSAVRGRRRARGEAARFARAQPCTLGGRSACPSSGPRFQPAAPSTAAARTERGRPEGGPLPSAGERDKSSAYNFTSRWRAAPARAPVPAARVTGGPADGRARAPPPAAAGPGRGAAAARRPLVCPRLLDSRRAARRSRGPPAPLAPPPMRGGPAGRRAGGPAAPPSPASRANGPQRSRSGPGEASSARGLGRRAPGRSHPAPSRLVGGGHLDVHLGARRHEHLAHGPGGWGVEGGCRGSGVWRRGTGRRPSGRACARGGAAGARQGPPTWAAPKQAPACPPFPPRSLHALLADGVLGLALGLAVGGLGETRAETSMRGRGGAPVAARAASQLQVQP
jgi:hypothetical protein